MICEASIDLWRVPFLLSEEAEKQLDGFLNFEERARSKQFHFPRAQRRYTISRGALRFLLARHLNNLPGNLVFGYGAFGKPFLADPPADSNLSFKLSHCTDMSVIAAASSRRLGVDLEKVRNIPELEQIAKAHFSKDECSFIESSPSTERVRPFLRIWTRREATAKAFGLDLSEALSRVTIPVYPSGERIRLEQEGTWFVTDLQLDPTHIGALCAEGDPCEIVYYDFRQYFSA